MPTIIWAQGGEHLEDPGIHIHSMEQLNNIFHSSEEKYKSQIIYMHEI